MHCHIFLISVIINKYSKSDPDAYFFSEFMLHCKASIFPILQAVNAVMSNFIPVLTVVSGEVTDICSVGLVRET